MTAVIVRRIGDSVVLFLDDDVVAFSRRDAAKVARAMRRVARPWRRWHPRPNGDPT